MVLQRRTHTEQQERQIILQRLRDYAAMDLARLRVEISARIKEEYPLAAAEQSAAFEPLERDEEWRKTDPDSADEHWSNNLYSVMLRRRKDHVFETRGMIQLGISSHDGTARHDWRDFQAIKNQLAGAECEAFELYPADSRLLDPSNYYTLWCFPHLKRLRVGLETRDVRDAAAAYAPQRALAPTSA